MSGLEIYGAVLATGTLIKVYKTARDHWKEPSRTWQSLNRAHETVKIQHETLRNSFNAVESTFKKYRRDLETSLSQEDRKAISRIIREINELGNKCESIATQLERAIKKDPIDDVEVRRLRDNLVTTVSGIDRWHNAFIAHISMESLRRLSTNASSTEPMNPTDKFETRSITSVESGPSAPSRRSTGFSTASTLSPSKTSRSSVSSAEASKLPSFVKNERLQRAVNTDDRETVESIVCSGGTETESLKTTALIYSCRYKKVSLVKYLLSINADINAYDDNGLGVVHCTIGTSQMLQPETAMKINKILEMLVENKASLLRPAKTSLRRTPIHYCAETGNSVTAKYILQAEHKAVNAVDEHKKTPLYLACEDNSPKDRLIQLLLDNGATFGEKSRPKISSREKRNTINEMLDKAYTKRSKTVKEPRNARAT